MGWINLHLLSVLRLIMQGVNRLQHSCEHQPAASMHMEDALDVDWANIGVLYDILACVCDDAHKRSTLHMQEARWRVSGLVQHSVQAVAREIKGHAAMDRCPRPGL